MNRERSFPSFAAALVCLVGLGCGEVAPKAAPTAPNPPSETPPPSPTTPTTPPDTARGDTVTPADTSGPSTTDTGPTPVPAQLVLSPIRDALLSQLNPDLNYGDRIELSGGTWTASGTSYSIRSLIAFDLSALPADAADVVGHLDLYAETTARLYGQGIYNNEPPGHSTLTAPNAFRLRRTLDPWDEATVTWNTQPSADPASSVWQPSSNAPDQDYLQIDVTPPIVDAIAAGATEVSLRLHQDVEVEYGEVTFATSDHTDPALHPVLTLDYVVPGTP